MATMSPEEWRAFLIEGTRTAKLATVSRDGAPTVVPVWFVLDGDDLVFETDGSSAKGRNLAAHPDVAICVDDERFPFAFVSIRGRARIDRPTVAELLPWTTRIARRYVGDARADAYGRRNAVEGGIVVRVPLERVLAERDVAA